MAMHQDMTQPDSTRLILTLETPINNSRSRMVIPLAEMEQKRYFAETKQCANHPPPQKKNNHRIVCDSCTPNSSKISPKHQPLLPLFKGLQRDLDAPVPRFLHFGDAAALHQLLQSCEEICPADSACAENDICGIAIWRFPRTGVP